MTKALTVCITILALASSLHAQSTDDKLMDHSNMDHTAHMKMMADAQRQAPVSQRGKDVMPFSLAATTHVFSKRADGGIQQVIAKNSQDNVQVKLVRQHLQQIRDEFLKGDFSDPTHIHGQSMPGLAELQTAKSGQIAIAYKDVKGGAALTYKTIEPSLVIALHKWFDAQLSDHGKDAMEGHHDHLSEMKKP
jgi:hypothetical protein